MDTSFGPWLRARRRALDLTQFVDCFSAIAVAAGNSANVWVGHDNGNVYKTANGTALGGV